MSSPWLDRDSAARMEAELVEESRAVLHRHARSFRVAAKALGDEEADDAALCYAFCRLADDVVDEAASPSEARAAIDGLRDELGGKRTPRPLVTAWLRLALRRRIPVGAARALLEAVASDVGRVRVADEAGLLRYAYGVAGTVGLMMCGVLGARDRGARPFAVDLGIGMQLTNIARDVAEDARRDRVYLPASWLRAAGVDPDEVVAGTAPRERVWTVVERLLDRAEEYYTSAMDGLRALPWRGRLTVLLALHLYRAIGRAVRRRGPAALADRTVLSRAWLVMLTVRAALDLLHPRALGLLATSSGADHAALDGLPGTRGPVLAVARAPLTLGASAHHG